MFLDLIWNTGRRRVALTVLRLPTSQGGLGAPDFKAYYFAGQLQWVAYWLAGRHYAETGLSRGPIRSGELNRLLLSKDLQNWDCPLLMGTARANPICGLPTKTDAIRLKDLTTWVDTNITTVGDLLDNGELLVFWS